MSSVVLLVLSQTLAPISSKYIILFFINYIELCIFTANTFFLFLFQVQTMTALKSWTGALQTSHSVIWPVRGRIFSFGLRLLRRTVIGWCLGQRSQPTFDQVRRLSGLRKLWIVRPLNLAKKKILQYRHIYLCKNKCWFSINV